MSSRWLHLLAAGVTLLAACSSGSAGGAGDGGATEASADGSDDATDEASSGSGSGGIGDGGGGPYPNADAPMFAADGCALLNVTCTNDAFCCSGHCTQGVCTMQGHPAHDPPRWQ